MRRRTLRSRNEMIMTEGNLVCLPIDLVDGQSFIVTTTDKGGNYSFTMTIIGDHDHKNLRLLMVRYHENGPLAGTTSARAIALRPHVSQELRVTFPAVGQTLAPRTVSLGTVTSITLN